MSCYCETTYSPQEQRIMDKNSGNLDYRKGRERVYRIIDRYQGVKPKIDIERACYFTQSMEKTEGKLLMLRWALAMKNVAEHITVYVDEDNLLAGRGGKAPRYGILYPEVCGNIIEETLDNISNRVGSSFDLDDEDIATLRREVVPYWKDRSFTNDFVRSLPEETRRIAYEGDELKARNILNESITLRGSLQWVPDYNKVMEKGFLKMKEEAAEQLTQLEKDDPMECIAQGDKYQYLVGIMAICDAIIIWAERHAEEALHQAEICTDPARKQELLDIADRAKHVPAHTPRNFPEAVQAMWFTALFHRLEFNTGGIVSNGRMDQYLYPFYKQDIEAGTLTEKQAMDYLECLWVSMAQNVDLKFAAHGGTMFEGYAHWEATTIGGQTRDGRDATNDLTYLMLRSKQEFTLDFPDLAARIHSRSPERYLREVAKTIKEGSGYPKLMNDEEIIPTLLSKGAPIEDAYDYAASGCSEARMPNVDTFTTAGVYVSVVTPVEMTLYNGRTYATGNDLVGLETGAPEALTTWEDFWNAYKAQLENLLHHVLTLQYYGIKLREKHFASPLSSCLHDLCMKNCKDLHSRVIPSGLDFGCFDVVGYASAANSLAGIKSLVYDKKEYSLAQVVNALENDFAGEEIMRQKMLKAPKYGNNDPYADEIAKNIEIVCAEFAEKASKYLGIYFEVRYVPVTAHVAFGTATGATPDGRHASVALSDGTSAAQGTDSKGPTAVLLSNAATKNLGYKERAARLLNLKFTPSCLKGEDGLENLVDFIRVWCDLKLWFVQFNVINTETLKKAQEHPEDYKSLLVRVAGYSAYFVSLSKDVQNDIITRSAHESI